MVCSRRWQRAQNALQASTLPAPASPPFILPADDLVGTAALCPHRLQRAGRGERDVGPCASCGLDCLAPTDSLTNTDTDLMTCLHYS